MTPCTATSPMVGVSCANRHHAPEVAHHASGSTPDGTRWTLFWWETEDGRPARSAEPDGLVVGTQG
jgi:hypothetical protein